jgi:zinc protease
MLGVSLPPLAEHTLDNGLRVLIERDPSLPLVALNLRYHVGSKNETPGRTGFAHLFEHMLFQGSEHVGTNDHFGHIQRVGGVANGMTSRDTTTYYETLPSSHLELGLWLESDRMGFLLPAMTEAKLENQRQVVMNERRQRVDNQPYGMAGERLFELLYPAPHPYSWPVIGTMEDIAAARLDQIQAFFETYYRPSNAVLTLVGDVEPQPALAAVERYFGDLPAGSRPAPVRAEEVELAKDLRQVLHDRVALARVYLAFRSPGVRQPGWYATALLSYVLAEGKSSPVYRDLVWERQQAQSVAAYVYPHELSGCFLMLASLRPGSDPVAAEAALRHHLEEVAGRGPRAVDLERARNRVTQEIYADLERVDRRAELYSELAILAGEPAELAREADHYLALSAEDLRTAAAALLAPGNGLTLTVLPEEA